MHLSYDEFEEFRKRYRFIEWPDEEYRVPVEVELAGGRETWTIFMADPPFHNVVEWLRAKRGRHRSGALG